MDLETLRTLPPRELASLLKTSPSVTLSELEGRTFRGITLAAHPWMTALTWETFQKVIRPTRDGKTTGYNVRLRQTGLAGKAEELPSLWWRPAHFGPFEVIVDGSGAASLDYNVPESRLSPLRWLHDPLVNVGTNLILGTSNVVVAGRTVPTPSYFALMDERLR